MKVLLTGASGLVGSHILDCLHARGVPTVAFLRPTSSRDFLPAPDEKLEVRLGTLTEPASLAAALEGVTHVIHCAGLTKAVRVAEFDRINRGGTRNVVQAINAIFPQVERLVHISSLAVSGSATRAAPVREDARPRPVSAYGHSKLAAEEEVRRRCRAPFTVLRPAAVYGPRDREFLELFRTVARGWLPVIGGGRQELSLVFVRDLAEAAVEVLLRATPGDHVYHVTGTEVITTLGLGEQIARILDRQVRQLPIPRAALPLICGAQSLWGRLRGQATVLGHGKYRELAAPGWVCDGSRLERELGIHCRTPLEAGLKITAGWYWRAGWLKPGAG